MTTPAQIEELKTLVEPGKVLTDADSLETYGKDWTKQFAPAPSAIVFPKSTEQVQAIVRWANRRRLVPDSVMERLRQRRGSVDYQATSGIMREVFVKLVNESYEAQLGAIACPVAFLWGRNDTAAPLAVAEQARTLVADVAAFEVVDTGHDVHRTHPAAFAPVIAAVERTA